MMARSRVAVLLCAIVVLAVGVWAGLTILRDERSTTGSPPTMAPTSTAPSSTVPPDVDVQGATVTTQVGGTSPLPPVTAVVSETAPAEVVAPETTASAASAAPALPTETGAAATAPSPVTEPAPPVSNDVPASAGTTLPPSAGTTLPVEVENPPGGGGAPAPGAQVPPSFEAGEDVGTADVDAQGQQEAEDAAQRERETQETFDPEGEPFVGPPPGDVAPVGNGDPIVSSP